jgi:hypothetical protein
MKSVNFFANFKKGDKVSFTFEDDCYEGVIVDKIYKSSHFINIEVNKINNEETIIKQYSASKLIFSQKENLDGSIEEVVVSTYYGINEMKDVKKI